ncbi:uncharacterized protein LOC130142034 [Falco biarmicus]|uniref:uncharacterized protein LOC129734847 n=1 Tax=Falco cherrug TaxID=345164 RepID=UPI00247A1C34|nr:uncharacterized protein LOC129734847 [Falco cherrug]XP_055649009.1 uncharacterized protein LOC129783181 [Falco peregrinus]XP_056179408.1 uncharacterized protein LOC130142034 [Falco biarmicus]
MSRSQTRERREENLLYPLRETAMGGPQPGVGFVSVPLSSGDVMEFKKEMGHLLEDPLGVAERFDQFLGPNIYTWDEMESILKILFTNEERGMIRTAGMRHWDQRHQQGPAGDEKWPLQRPNWNNQDLVHRNNMVDLRDMIIQRIRELQVIGAKEEPFKVPLKRNVTIEAPNKYGVGTFLLVPEAEYNLLGRDLMVELGINLEVDQEELKIRLCLLTTEDEAKINPETWYSPGSVGKLNIKPITVSIKDPDQPIRIKQYPISREGREGLQPVIEGLLAQGLLEPCMSPHNTPILPVKKPDGSYRLVQDLRAVNE